MSLRKVKPKVQLTEAIKDKQGLCLPGSWCRIGRICIFFKNNLDNSLVTDVNNWQYWKTSLRFLTTFNDRTCISQQNDLDSICIWHEQLSVLKTSWTRIILGFGWYLGLTGSASYNWMLWIVRSICIWRQRLTVLKDQQSLQDPLFSMLVWIDRICMLLWNALDGSVCV